jgi:hypothetical protein
MLIGIIQLKISKPGTEQPPFVSWWRVTLLHEQQLLNKRFIPPIFQSFFGIAALKAKRNSCGLADSVYIYIY